MKFLVGAVVALVLVGWAAGDGAPGGGPDGIRLLVVGDSFVVGEGVGDGEDWPAQLVRSLAADGIAVDLEVIGGTGWTSQRAASEMARATLRGQYDLVFVGVGVNDHFNRYGVAVLERGVSSILELAGAHVAAPGDVVLLSIVDWRATPRGAEYAGTWRESDVGPYNAVLARLAAERGHRYVDVTTASLAMAGDPALVAPDGLHASGALYAEWVEILRRAAPWGRNP